MRFNILFSRSKGDWFEGKLIEEFTEAIAMDLKALIPYKKEEMQTTEQA
jgi:hypothetical protein